MNLFVARYLEINNVIDCMKKEQEKDKQTNETNCYDTQP